MIRPCELGDIHNLFAIINDAAQAYHGVIPADCWREPYMPLLVLERELGAGVSFWGYQEGEELLGVMGIQPKGDVALIRHAYVRTAARNRGIGGRLLEMLRTTTDQPILIGTWAAAEWAIGFYQKHGFRLTTPEVKDRLLRKYWTISDRQVETSVVLAEEAWFTREQ